MADILVKHGRRDPGDSMTAGNVLPFAGVDAAVVTAFTRGRE